MRRCRYTRHRRTCRPNDWGSGSRHAVEVPGVSSRVLFGSWDDNCPGPSFRGLNRKINLNPLWSQILRKGGRLIETCGHFSRCEEGPPTSRNSAREVREDCKDKIRLPVHESSHGHLHKQAMFRLRLPHQLVMPPRARGYRGYWLDIASRLPTGIGPLSTEEGHESPQPSFSASHCWAG